MSFALGVDLGGSTLRAALVDDTGTVVHSRRAALGERDKNPAAIGELLATTLADMPREARKSGVTVAVAGSVLAREGVVDVAPNLGWRNVPLGDTLTRRLGEHVRIVNDLNAITYGEAKVGGGRGARDVVCLFVGTGFGAGAVVGGVLHEGAHGLAPELGHLKVSTARDARSCGCGHTGCLEAYVGGAHLGGLVCDEVKRSRRATSLAKGKGHEGGDCDCRVTAVELAQAAQAGDMVATTVLEGVARQLGWALSTSLYAFNPEVVIWGGGVVQGVPGLVERAREQASHLTWESFFSRVRIVTTTLGDEAGVIGAALLGLGRPA